MESENNMKIPISDIKPNPSNPRIIKDDKFKKLVQSIKDFPEMSEVREIIVNKDMVILGGNMRFRAMQEAGWKEVPIRIVDWTEEKQKEFIIKDNVSGGEWDWDLLANEWDKEQLEEWGMDIDKWTDEVKEDKAPEVSSEPAVSKLGEVYILGKHRLVCGDATKIDDVEKLMDGKKADMVFTDPPYRIETQGGKKGNLGKSLQKQGSDIDFISDFETAPFLEQLNTVFIKNKFNAYIFTNKLLLPEYLNWIVKQKLAFNVLVWKKPNAIPIGSDYRPDIEYLIFIRKNATWNSGISGANYSRVFEVDREKGLHPTMKPVEIITSCLKVSSNKEDKILDFYGGSGSTLIACEQTNRVAFLMELDEKYCDVIRKRYWKFTHDNIEDGWQEGTPVIL